MGSCPHLLDMGGCMMKRYYEVMLVLCGLLCLPGCANNNRLSMEKSAAEHNEEKSFESVRNVPEGEAFSAASEALLSAGRADLYIVEFKFKNANSSHQSIGIFNPRPNF